MCSSVFTCKSEVKKYLQVHGKKEILWFQNSYNLVLCLKCNLSFQSKKEFEIHQGKIHGGKKQINKIPISCENCRFCPTSKNHLKRHQKSNHDSL